jgi:hypothetical protein
VSVALMAKAVTLSASENAALAQAAATLGIPSAWLSAAIAHESGWNPAIKNPLSSARGLLQWIDSTAKGLGYKDSADLIAKNPTREQQLVGPVVGYLSKFKPFNSIEEVAAAIFYPAYKNKLDTPLPAAVQKANPGIVTLRDYANRYLLPKATTAAGAGVALLAFGAAAWWWFTRH